MPLILALIQVQLTIFCELWAALSGTVVAADDAATVEDPAARAVKRVCSRSEAGSHGREAGWQRGKAGPFWQFHPRSNERVQLQNGKPARPYATTHGQQGLRRRGTRRLLSSGRVARINPLYGCLGKGAPPPPPI